MVSALIGSDGAVTSRLRVSTVGQVGSLTTDRLAWVSVLRWPHPRLLLLRIGRLTTDLAGSQLCFVVRHVLMISRSGIPHRRRFGTTPPAA